MHTFADVDQKVLTPERALLIAYIYDRSVFPAAPSIFLPLLFLALVSVSDYGFRVRFA